MMDSNATSYDPIPAGTDLNQLTGCGTYSATGRDRIELRVEYIDMQKYMGFAIEKCADMLDAVLAETHPKCEFCSNRHSCHGFSDCEWNRKSETIRLRNLCRALAARNEARGGQCDESESG